MQNPIRKRQALIAAGAGAAIGFYGAVIGSRDLSPRALRLRSSRRRCRCSRGYHGA